MKRFSLLLLAPILALLAPEKAAALTLPGAWANSICTAIPCNGISMSGAAGFADYMWDKLVTTLQVSFVAAAIITLFLATFNMVIFSSDENAVKEARASFYYTIIGAVFVGLSHWIVQAFSPTENVIVNLTPLEAGIANVIMFINMMLTIALIANTVIQAFRIISSHGEQDQLDKARKRLVTGFIGVGIVLLANALVNTSKPGRNSNIAAGEMVGIANFMLALIGTLAVIAIIVAGILLIVSVDEGLKDKAKTAIRVAVIALFIVIISYALVLTASSISV